VKEGDGEASARGVLVGVLVGADVGVAVGVVGGPGSWRATV
jgi:hypothetical protein